MMGTDNGNTVNKGVISELRVEVDLLSKGYHVFRSESPGCPCDIVAIRNGECIKVEVKSISSNRGIRKSDYQEHLPGFIDWWAFVLPNKIIYAKSENSCQDIPV